MKYIIVGAVAGGASTAARLRRLDEHAEIVMFEKGEYMSYANCGLPYYIGDVIKDRNKLFVQSATSFKNRFNIDVRTKTLVTAINAEEKKVYATNLVSGEQYEESYDKLVLSPGAEPVRPPLPGINLPGIFTVRTVEDSDLIKAYVQQKNATRAVIIGAGFIGLEMAENFKDAGLEVTIVEMGEQILPPVDYPIAAILQQHIRTKGVDLLLNTTVTGFSKEEDQLQVQVKNGELLEADIVILSIGVRPDTRLASMAGLKIGEAKGIWVNEYLQTSDPNIYAVGDAIEFISPISKKPGLTFLAGPANKQGRICAHNLVAGNNEKYSGSINTAIVKVFDMTVAVTGMAAKHLAASGISFITSTTHSGSHAGYYPGAKNLTIQVAFSPADGTLLGAQVAGFKGVDKRLDILAQIIKTNGTIYDLMEFEHAYAPPFSSAKDPVNMAGFVAENILQKRLELVYWNELEAMEEDALLIDVRTPTEHAAGTIPGAINIPVDTLRGRLADIPVDQKVYIFCQIGLRGYLAQRILKQNGFANVLNLSGGYSLWKTIQDEKMLSMNLSETLA